MKKIINYQSSEGRFRQIIARVYGPKTQQNVLQALPFGIAAFITGIIAVLYTKLFAGAESIAAWFIHGHKWWLFLATPACFLIAFLLVKKFAPYARGSGIPQVMTAIDLANPREDHKVHKLLSIKVIVVKILSNILVAIGGGATGREGPTIQIAGSVFRKVNQWIPASWPRVSRRNMIMTGLLLVWQQPLILPLVVLYSLWRSLRACTSGITALRSFLQ